MAIDPRLKRKLARAAAAAAERDALIVEAARAGASLREIAGIVGVSHVTVKNIVDRASTAHAKEPPPTRR